jgi:hypothetical protein
MNPAAIIDRKQENNIRFNVFREYGYGNRDK